MNPKKLGGLANHDQERWKAPLPEFIEDLYLKRFGRERPDEVVSIEGMLERRRMKKGKVEPQRNPAAGKPDTEFDAGDPF